MLKIGASFLLSTRNDTTPVIFESMYLNGELVFLNQTRPASYIFLSLWNALSVPPLSGCSDSAALLYPRLMSDRDWNVVF
jgi:hypothetical protein